jgi:hypothetical protein
VALNEKWGFAYANLFASQQTVLTFQARGIAGSGGLPHQRAYPSSKDVGWIVFLEVEPRKFGVFLAEGLCNLGGISSTEGLRDGETGRAPFLIMACIRLKTEKKHGKPQSGQPSSQGTASCADFAVFRGTASAGLLHVSSPQLPR